MPLLSGADAIYVGGTLATRVYAGSQLVWEPAPTSAPVSVLVEAESFSGSFGIGTEACQDIGGGQNIGGIGNGDWTTYENVDLTGIIAVSARIASGPTAEAGSIVVRQGGTSGTIIATIPMGSRTGGWQTWETRSAVLETSLTGVQTIALTFESEGAGGGDIGNLNWIRFDTVPVIESFSAVEYSGTTLDYWTLDIPAGTQPGDYLVAFLHSQKSGMASDASASGWTRLGGAFVTTPGDERYGAAFGRVADGTEGATVTFLDEAVGPRKLGCVVRLTGVDTTHAVVAYTDNQTLDTVMDTAVFSGGPHLELTHIGATCAAGNYGTIATAGVGTTIVTTGAGPADDGTASADWQHVYRRAVTDGGGGLTWALDGPAPAADHMNCYVIRAAMVWDVKEAFESRPTGVLTANNGMTTAFGCTVTDVGPLSGSQSMLTQADGTFSAIRYPTGGSFTCEFIAKKNAGTQTNHAMLWVGELDDALRADLQFRNDGSGQLWLRYNYGAPASGKSTEAFWVGEVFRVRIRFVAGVSLEADLWYGANLNGATPDETLNVNSVAELATDAPLADAWLGNYQASGLQFMYDDVRVDGLA